jgi:hypothetical protein
MPPTEEQLAGLQLNRTEFDALMAEKATIEADIARAFEGLLAYGIPALQDAQQKIVAKATVINRQVADMGLGDENLVDPQTAFVVLGKQFHMLTPAKKYLRDLAGNYANRP